MPAPDSLTSYWMDSSPSTTFPRLTEPLRVDVAVVGGGIAGLSTALELKRRGKTVALIEAGRVAASVSGYTTAKITSLHTNAYTSLVRSHGGDGAHAYGQSQEAGLARIAELVAELSIDCDFERQDSYTYSTSPEDAESLEAEARIAASLGLPSTFVTETALPFAVTGAVRFTDQAQFHPRKYLLALADEIDGDGSVVLEQTRMRGVREGSPCTVVCDSGEVVADYVVIATHYPVLDRGLLFPRLDPHRDAVVAGLLPDDQDLQGMYISTDPGTHSVRVAPHEQGRLLIVGGEPWKTGQEEDVEARFAALTQWMTKEFGIARPLYRWSTQDLTSADGVPYIGLLHPGTDNVYVATGFRGWGMTNGTVSGLLLADLIDGTQNPWAELYDPRRIKPVSSARTVLKTAVDSVKGLVENILPAEVDDVSDIGAGQGAIARVNGDKAAVYRDDDGALHCVSARCTHLGCLLHFNNAERSWDCPCHGSRFDHEGAVLEGPANRPLARVTPEQSA